MKEHGYRLPVLLASSFMNDISASNGIPQNWIVDRKGTWQKMGFGTVANWGNSILQELEATKVRTVNKDSQCCPLLLQVFCCSANRERRRSAFWSRRCKRILSEAEKTKTRKDQYGE